LLNLCPYAPDNCTVDKEDDNIIYGDRFVKLRARLLYLSCERLLSKAQYKNDKSLLIIREMFYKNEYQNIINYVEKNKEVYEKYGIVDGLFIYFRSHELDNGRNDFYSADVKHRLYLTLGLDCRALFSKIFIEECVRQNIPYYFKVFRRKGQTDTVVIYCNNEENLLKYVNIISDIYDRYPRFKDETKSSVPHLCKVNDYIGYGFEPYSDNSLSYTQFMKYCYGIVKEKCDELILKINNTYKIYGYDKMTKEAKYKFLETYKKHFYKTFGLEINEILNEIGEQSRLRKEKKNGFSRK